MNWLTQSWWSLLHPVITGMLLTLASTVCGGWIGLERERHEKAAGMRTLMLVCLGATVFTMTGFAFTSKTGDSGRVAAQIVTGIGFLGAGVILHERRVVSGTTTAATIWITAAIGLTIGAGFPLSGLGLAGLVRLVLNGLRRYESRFIDRARRLHLRVTFSPEQGKTRAHLARILADAEAIGAVWGAEGDGPRSLDITLELPLRRLRELIAEIASLAAVRSIEESEVTPDQEKAGRLNS